MKNILLFTLLALSFSNALAHDVTKNIEHIKTELANIGANTKAAATTAATDVRNAAKAELEAAKRQLAHIETELKNGMATAKANALETAKQYLHEAENKVAEMNHHLDDEHKHNQLLDTTKHESKDVFAIVKANPGETAIIGAMVAAIIALAYYAYKNQ